MLSSFLGLGSDLTEKRDTTDTKRAFLYDFQAIVIIIITIITIIVIINTEYVKLSTGLFGIGQGPVPSS
jgi:uncharacterized integral membrane protein